MGRLFQNVAPECGLTAAAPFAPAPDSVGNCAFEVVDAVEEKPAAKGREGVVL